MRATRARNFLVWGSAFALTPGFHNIENQRVPTPFLLDTFFSISMGLIVCLSVNLIQSISPMKMNLVDVSSLHLGGVFFGCGGFFFFFYRNVCHLCCCEMKWGSQAA